MTKTKLAVVDIDPEGKNGGTLYEVTITLQHRILESKESFLKKAEEAYNILNRNIIS